MDLLALVRTMQQDGTVQTLARDPMAQFGPPNRTYLGATLIPERTVPLNAYRENSIRYRTVIANSGSRYSPTQIKDDTALAGSMLVELGNQDIGRNFTGEDYDAFLTLLASRPTMDAVLSMVRWLDITVLRAILDLNEKMRWNAMVAASVVMSGDNGYTETVTYPNPAGSRVAQAAPWSTDTTAIYDEIVARVQYLADKGYTVDRIVSSRRVSTIMARNTTIQERAGARIFVTNAGSINSRPNPLISLADLNGILNADGLPPIEIYDAQYFDYAGAHRFLPDDVMMFFATTGQSQAVVEAAYYESGTIPIVENILGYFAIGRPAGQPDSGRVIRMEAKDDKPPRVEAEGWQTGLPVVLEPEAITAITGIT